MSLFDYYRVWPDGTIQECDEPPYNHMSDDFVVIEASSIYEAEMRAEELGLL